MSTTTLSKRKKASRASASMNSNVILRDFASNHAGQPATDPHRSHARSSKKPGKATQKMTTCIRLPSPASINGAEHSTVDTHAESVRPTAQTGKAKGPVNSTDSLPSPSQSSPDGPTVPVSQRGNASGVDDLCQQLKFLHRQHRNWMKAEQRLLLPLLSLFRYRFGWQGTFQEDQRKPIREAARAAAVRMKKQAEKLVKSAKNPIALAEQEAEFFASATDDACRDLSDSAWTYALSVVPIQRKIASIEKQMTKIAELLPGWSFVEGVNGYGAVGFASIVGECGNLSNFASPAKLWKFLGIAPKHCYIKQAGGVPEIPKERRSVSWKYAESMFKAKNAYTTLYRSRREYEAANHPEFDTGKTNAKGGKQLTKHCDNRARRYAEKRFLRDLWRAWQAAIKLRKAA